MDRLRASGKPVVLIFTDPTCGPCRALLPEIGRWQRAHARTLTLALISRGSVEANQAKVTEHGIGPVLLQQDREVARAYQSVPTPSAVLIHPDGTIGSPVALGSEAIRALFRRVTTKPAPTIPLRLVPADGTARNRHGGALYETYNVPRDMTVNDAVRQGLVPQEALDRALTVNDDDIDAALEHLDRNEGA